MLGCFCETMFGLITWTWTHITSGLANLTDLLFTADNVQSFSLAVFALGLLSFSVVCLVLGLLHKRDAASQKEKKGRPTRQFSVAAHWRRGADAEFVTDPCSSKYGFETASGHGAKRWNSHHRQDRVSGNLRRGSPHRVGQVIISCREIPRSQPLLSCRSCGLLPAKRKCSYQRCGGCCRGNKSSVCSAHGTGDAAALCVVETACDEKPLEMDLSYMNLKCCPQMIGFVGRQLTILNLSNNRLTSLPDEIGLLGGLEQLFLQYNCLDKLPKCIGNFSKLQELDCKNNRLHSLPSTLGNLSQLVIFNVTNNLLAELSPAIGQLTQLEELCIHSNQLTTLPDELCNLVNLTALYVGENPLCKLPAAFGRLVRLTELDLSSCALQMLPASLSRCTSLNKIWLSNNRLTSLPPQIGRLHQLKELHVRNNPIRYFPASLSYLQLYTFSVNQDKLLNEWDQEVRSQLTVYPGVRVAPLQELAARCVIKNGVRWSKGDLPIKLSEMLENVRWCSCCEGPFFMYYSSELVFANIGIFHRVPLYQQICSPYYNLHCQPVTWKHHQHQVNDQR